MTGLFAGPSDNTQDRRWRIRCGIVVERGTLVLEDLPTRHRSHPNNLDGTCYARNNGYRNAGRRAEVAVPGFEAAQSVGSATECQVLCSTLYESTYFTYHANGDCWLSTSLATPER